MSDKEQKRRADAAQKQKVLSRWENEGGRVETVKKKRPRDANQLARLVVDIATGQVEDMSSGSETDAQRLGREGGLKGGKARAKALTPERRREIAKRAARARWERKG